MTRRNGVGTSEATLAGLRVLETCTNQTVRLVYSTAVQFMNSRTLELAPGHERLATLVGRDVRSVERCIKFLMTNGLLQVVRRGNRHQATIYQLGPTVLVTLRSKSEAE